jgi:hypothetical protein
MDRHRELRFKPGPDEYAAAGVGRDSGGRGFSAVVLLFVLMSITGCTHLNKVCPGTGNELCRAGMIAAGIGLTALTLGPVIQDTFSNIGPQNSNAGNETAAKGTADAADIEVIKDQQNEEILPDKQLLSADLEKRVLAHLEKMGYDVSQPRFEDEWSQILFAEFGLRGDLLVANDIFTPDEVNRIREYTDIVQMDINERTAFSRVERIGPDDGQGIPFSEWQAKIDKDLGRLDEILHMWDQIAAIGGAAVPGAASTALIEGMPGRTPVTVTSRPNRGSGGGKPNTPEQTALIKMAKQDAKTGISKGDAEAYKELGKEAGVPVRGPESHPDRPAPSSQMPHIHVGPVDHIPVR